MAADLIAKLADKKSALEGLQGFETLFGEADAKAKISLLFAFGKADGCLR
jgi:hypothetical protein